MRPTIRATKGQRATSEPIRMDRRSHWENIYRTKLPTQVSWYQVHAKRSLDLIRRVSPPADGAIIDVGGGASTLIDDLLDRKSTRLNSSHPSISYAVFCL